MYKYGVYVILQRMVKWYISFLCSKYCFIPIILCAIYCQKQKKINCLYGSGIIRMVTQLQSNIPWTWHFIAAICLYILQQFTIYFMEHMKSKTTKNDLLYKHYIYISGYDLTILLIQAVDLSLQFHFLLIFISLMKKRRTY